MNGDFFEVEKTHGKVYQTQGRNTTWWVNRSGSPSTETQCSRDRRERCETRRFPTLQMTTQEHPSQAEITFRNQSWGFSGRQLMQWVVCRLPRNLLREGSTQSSWLTSLNKKSETVWCVCVTETAYDLERWCWVFPDLDISGVFCLEYHVHSWGDPPPCRYTL